MEKLFKSRTRRDVRKDVQVVEGEDSRVGVGVGVGVGIGVEVK